MRQGQKLSPYQLLDIQRGLWGGGGADKGPSYSTQLIKKANSRDLLKQYLEAGSGRVIDDAEADEFAELIRKKQLAKPTKTEVKKVGGKKVTVITPGFGEAEAADIAEKRAMKEPSLLNGTSSGLTTPSCSYKIPKPACQLACPSFI